MWFDWYTKWSVIEVQGTSQAKYSTMGVPYSKKHFDYNSDSNLIMADVEGYFTRISKNRRNYLPLWSYTPYTYNKANVWSVNNDFNLLNPLTNRDFETFVKTSKSMSWVENSIAFTKNTSDNFTPSFSNSQKSNWRPYASIQSYYYNLSKLTDILTHREYLYRQYLEKNNKIFNLPKLLTVTPYNPLITELKSSFLLNDPITYSSEYSRDFFCQSLSFFKFLIFKELARSISYEVNRLPINANLVNDYLFFYFLGTEDGIKVGNNNELFKNQFRPLKKGISNMMRLQGTGAVAMPIEIRLQILASSRDVIHSWAIPSAGIKIDCIPGYTSHRIMIFLTPGIYWGQCMEICGRYHHWMPIIVYFMKRDLFFLWCTHFMSKPNVNQVWDINDRQFADYLRFVSYDRSTWLTELSKRSN
jgi:heme/copper-type cytochrome/quinol oxidase subunit 2